MREILHLQAGQCGNQIGAKFRSAWKRFLNIPATLSEVSLDAEITTGMTKLVTGHQVELPAHPMNNCNSAHPPGLIMCCLAHDEHRQPTTDRYERSLEMKSCNPQTLDKRPETYIGDVSL